MSIDAFTPTEYFGPHAKRWTHPDTGVILSLNPKDYARAVDHWAQLQEERREEELREEAVNAAWDDKALDEGVVTIEAQGAEDAGTLESGTVRFLSLSEDDRFGLIRPVEQSAPGKPAARHFRRRRIGRNTLRLGLVYIIAVIGVLAVAGVIS